MKCEKCKATTYVIYVAPDYRKLCGSCHDKEKGNEKKNNRPDDHVCPACDSGHCNPYHCAYSDKIKPKVGKEK